MQISLIILIGLTSTCTAYIDKHLVNCYSNECQRLDVQDGLAEFDMKVRPTPDLGYAGIQTLSNGDVVSGLVLKRREGLCMYYAYENQGEKNCESIRVLKKSSLNNRECEYYEDRIKGVNVVNFRNRIPVEILYNNERNFGILDDRSRLVKYWSFVDGVVTYKFKDAKYVTRLLHCIV
uniref:Candidate secreted effector protein n=1 Tax=Rhabditophanes sp. KR3021 TaxID=114890 RepID=A0AC35U4Z5_9BILA